MGTRVALPGTPSSTGALAPSEYAVEFAGWNGWRLLEPPPVAVTLENLGLQLRYAQGAWAGRAVGSLTIGSGAEAGTIALKLAFPYDPTAFELSYEPTPGRQPPTIAALVSFLAAGWTLPGPVNDFAKEITLEKFSVGVGEINSLSVSLSAFPGKSWPLVPGDARFTLSRVFLRMAVASQGEPTGAIGATFTIGQGRIPLLASLRRSWSEFSIGLDPAGGGATLPSVGDLANLIHEGWSNALPPEIANLGASTDLKQFEFARLSSGWSLAIAVSTKPGWRYKPIPDFDGLLFESAAIEFAKPAAGSTSGRATLQTKVVGLSTTFLLTVPQPTLIGRLQSDALNLGVLCSYVVDASLPDWLESIGLHAMELVVEFTKKIFRLSARLVKDLSLPGGSVLRRVAVSGVIGQGRASLCIEAEWEPAASRSLLAPAAGKGIAGRLCFPFDRFNPNGAKQSIRFPPPRGPVPPNPSAPPPYEAVLALVIGVIAAGIAAAAMAAAAYDASACEAAAAIIESKKGDAELDELARSIRQEYEYNGQALLFLRDMQCAFERLKKTLRIEQAALMLCGGQFTPVEAAQALMVVYKPTAAQMVSALWQGWQGKLPAEQMTAALAACSYDPLACAPVVQALYALTPPAFAFAFAGAGFSQLTVTTLARALTAAPFPASGVAAGVFAIYPNIELTPALCALSACGFVSYVALPAVLPHYYPISDYSPAYALVAAYPGIEPLPAAVALGVSRMFVDFQLHAIFKSLQPTATGPLGQGLSSSVFAAQLVETVRLRQTHTPLAAGAQTLVRLWPEMSIYTLTALLATLYAPPLRELALTVVELLPKNEEQPNDGMLAPLLYAPAKIAPAEVASPYLAAVKQTRKPLPKATFLGGGLMYAFNSVGRTQGPTPAMHGLLAAYTSVGETLAPAEAVNAVYQWFRANVRDAVEALVASYTNPPIVPGECARAITYGIPQRVDAATLASALIGVFSLRQCPTATGAAALALRQGEPSLAEFLAVLPGLMSGWDARAEATVRDVFSNKVWQTAYNYRVQFHADPSDIAQILKRESPAIAPLRVVELLAAVFVLPEPGPAATPLARALKSIGVPYASALAALQAFYGSRWTPADTEKVRAVYT